MTGSRDVWHWPGHMIVGRDRVLARGVIPWHKQSALAVHAILANGGPETAECVDQSDRYCSETSRNLTRPARLRLVAHAVVVVVVVEHKYKYQHDARETSSGIHLLKNHKYYTWTCDAVLA